MKCVNLKRKYLNKTFNIEARKTRNLDWLLKKKEQEKVKMKNM